MNSPVSISRDRWWGSTLLSKWHLGVLLSTSDRPPFYHPSTLASAGGSRYLSVTLEPPTNLQLQQQRHRRGRCNIVVDMLSSRDWPQPAPRSRPDISVASRAPAYHLLLASLAGAARPPCRSSPRCCLVTTVNRLTSLDLIIRLFVVVPLLPRRRWFVCVAVRASSRWNRSKARNSFRLPGRLQSSSDDDIVASPGRPTIRAPYVRAHLFLKVRKQEPCTRRRISSDILGLAMHPRAKRHPAAGPRVPGSYRL